jgi:serine/threonine protein kinase
VVKLSLHLDEVAIEIKTLLQMKKLRNSSGVSELIVYNLLFLKNFDENSSAEEVCSYYIMPRYTSTLEHYFKIKIPDTASILRAACILISSLKTVHSTGRTYNDMKPENVMVRDKKVVLIDFGFADKFVNQDGTHVAEDTTVCSFKGNLAFASLRALNFKTTTRKDDLCSLAYMIMYFFNDK